MSDDPPAERPSAPDPPLAAPPEAAGAALPAIEGAFPPVEVEEIEPEEIFAPVAVDPAGVAAALPPAATEGGHARRARKRTPAALDEIRRRLGDAEAHLRALEDRLLRLEGLERVVVAQAEAVAKVAASDAAADRLERVFDRLARLEARLPPAPPAGGGTAEG
jgi:hypothetical protein